MSTDKIKSPVHKAKFPELDQQPPKNLVRPETSAKPGSTKPEKSDDELETSTT